MMRDWLEIGPSPYEESCAQVGKDGYHVVSRVECQQLIRMLRIMHGPETGSANLRTKANEHEFGTYYEVACYYDDGDQEGMAYALKCEGDMPKNWDKEAKKAIKACMEKHRLTDDIFGGKEDLDPDEFPNDPL